MIPCTIFDTRLPWFLVTKKFPRVCCFLPLRLFLPVFVGRRYQYLFQSIPTIGITASLFGSRNHDPFGHGRRRQTSGRRKHDDSARRTRTALVLFYGFPAGGGK